LSWLASPFKLCGVVLVMMEAASLSKEKEEKESLRGRG
jgi:hypothetical protein